MYSFSVDVKLDFLNYPPSLPTSQVTGSVPPPHLVVISPGKYVPDLEAFDTPEDTTRDKLLPKGYIYCCYEEYHLG